MISGTFNVILEIEQNVKEMFNKTNNLLVENLYSSWTYFLVLTWVRITFIHNPIIR